MNNAYLYDAMGNRTRTARQAGQSNRSDLSYVPNKLNQLLSYSETSARQASGNTSYSYNARGDRQNAGLPALRNTTSEQHEKVG